MFGSGVVQLGVTGRPSSVVTTYTDFDGHYAIHGEFDRSDCARLYVAVTVQDFTTGMILGTAMEPLGSCGTHVVDLVL